MTTSVFYDKDSSAWKKADEMIIEYHGLNSDAVLKPFLDVNANKTIVLTIDPKDISEKLWNVFTEIKDYKNFKIKFLNMFSTMVHRKIKELGIPYFFGSHIAHTYEDFYFLTEQAEADEIYIGIDLGFDLRNVKELADKKGVKLRAFPNYAMGRYEHIDRTKMFFIRPEDIDEYAKYIDTFELMGTPSIVDVAYRVYFERKSWLGKLEEIIIGLAPCDLDSRYLLPFWGKRANCKRRCITGGTCDLCGSMQKISEIFEKAEIDIPKDIPVPEIKEQKEMVKPNF